MRTSAFLCLGLTLLLRAQAPQTAAEAQTPETKATEILRKALESKNPDTRRNAVVALSLASGNDPLYKRLELMLDDKDVLVRLAVVSSLADVKTPEAIKALETALNDEVAEVSFAAAKALFALNNPEGKKALLAILEKETKANSGFLTREKRTALRMMHTPATGFLYAARMGATFSGVPGLGFGIASFQSIMSDSNVSGPATAALLLGREKDPETINALKEALSDKDWRLRAAAVHSLALQDDPSMRKILDPMIEDDRDEVRLRAAAAMLRLSAVEKAQQFRRAPAKKAPTKKAPAKNS
jgi:HEAT repeat protein